MSRTLVGALIKLQMNGQDFTTVTEVQYDIDHGEKTIEGIDSMFPQEIAPTKHIVRGSVTGVKMKSSGGLQQLGLRPVLTTLLGSPYISIKILDRYTGEEILFIPQAKISRESFRAAARGIVNVNFSFIGVAGYQPLDRA